MKTQSSLPLNLLLLASFQLHTAFAQSTTIQELESPAAAPADQLLVSRDHANRLVVQVLLNDQGPFAFLLDTGANQSAVSVALAQKLQLESASPAILQGVTGEATVARVKVATLEAGSLQLSNQKLAVINATLDGLDGVLGVDGFKNKRVAAHIVNNVVTITRSQSRSQSPTYADYATFPLEFRNGLLALIPGSVPGVSIKAVIDTGSQGSLGTEPLRASLVLRGDTGHTQTITRVQGVTGAIQRGQSHLTPLIRLDCVGSTSYEYILVRNIPIAYGDFHVFKLWGLRYEPALLVGMDILGRMDEVVIDYGNKQMYWKQAADESPNRQSSVPNANGS